MFKLRARRIQIIFLVLCTVVAGFGTLMMSGTANASTPHVAPALANGGIFQIHSQVPNKKTYCLGIYQGHQGPGASTIIWNCNGNADQNWQGQYIGTDGNTPYYRFQNMNSKPNAPQCLALLQGSSGEGASPIQWSCNNNTDQQWYFTDLGGTTFKLSNRNTGYCLGVEYGDVFSGAIPVQWACNANPDQLWD